MIVHLLEKMKLDETNINRIFSTVEAYSKEKGISVESIEAIMLPYLLQLSAGFESMGNMNIPAVAVAQYLTGVFEKLGVKTEEDAQLLAEKVKQIFEAENAEE